MEYLPERANRQALLLKTRVKAHDRILRCRINAAFRSQVERRIYAAERGARRNLSCAPASKNYCIAVHRRISFDQLGPNCCDMNRKLQDSERGPWDFIMFGLTFYGFVFT